MKNLKSAYAVENGRYIVTFSEIYTVRGSKFFVEVNGVTQSSFEMISSNGGWRIVPPVPAWIYRIEAQLLTILYQDFQTPRLETHLQETYE